MKIKQRYQTTISPALNQKNGELWFPRASGNRISTF